MALPASNFSFIHQRALRECHPQKSGRKLSRATIPTLGFAFSSRIERSEESFFHYKERSERTPQNLESSLNSLLTECSFSFKLENNIDNDLGFY